MGMGMGMGMGEICSAINEIDGKKENLRESLKQLQQSTWNLKLLKWEDLDSYFKTLESSLQAKFNLLQSSDQPELKRLCEDSDGSGLQQFITSAADPLPILVEAFGRYAPHTAPAMVLDSISSSSDLDLDDPSSPPIIMLQALIRFMQNQPPADPEFQNKAKRIAVQLRRTCCLGFLLLVRASGLVHLFAIHDLLDSLFVLAQTQPSHAIHLSPHILSPDHINDLIQKLIDKDMHITAVSFSVQLNTTDHFPPVGLLEERRLMSITAIEDARDNVDNHQACNEVMLREIDTLKAIIKCVDENHLQSEYPKDSVVEHVNKLEKEVENAKQDLVEKRNNDPGSRKRPATARVSKKKQLSKPKKPKQNKFIQTATSAEPPPTTQNVMPVEEPHSQASDLMPDHIDQYHSSSCGSDACCQSDTGPFASPCELARANSGHSGNLMPVDDGTGFFVSQSHPQSCYNSNGWISE